MKAKAQSMPLNTIVIFIIILVALVLIILFISKYGSGIWSGIGQQVNSSIAISQDVPQLPQP